MINEHRRVRLERCLAGHGVSLDQLTAKANCVVLFGSRAAAAHNSGSDWDILCVGGGPRIKSEQLDLIWVSASRSETNEWLGSELAQHVAAFGVPISGPTQWISQVRPSDDAIAKKTRRIRNRLLLLQRAWAGLTPGFREKHRSLLLNDVYRLAYLQRRDAVPPTPLLRRPSGGAVRVLEGSSFQPAHREALADVVRSDYTNSRKM